MHPEVLRGVDDLASRQHAVLHWNQFLECGVPPSTVAEWHRYGMIERVAPAVYRFAGSPRTWRQELMTAVLDSGGWASHRSSAALHVVDGHPGRIIEVSVLRWARSGRWSGYKVHETKDLKPSDCTVRDGIPCTTLVRTLVDLPAVEHPFRAAQALDDAMRRDERIIESVRQRFIEVARRGRNGTTVMRELLAERPGGYIPPGSAFEAMMFRLVKGLDVPEPQKQCPVRDGDFVAFVDMGWPDIRFGLECDSIAYHASPSAVARDQRRRRRLKRLGWDLAEYTFVEVRDEPARVGAEIAELYHLLASTKPGCRPD